MVMPMVPLDSFYLPVCRILPVRIGEPVNGVPEWFSGVYHFGEYQVVVVYEPEETEGIFEGGKLGTRGHDMSEVLVVSVKVVV